MFNIFSSSRGTYLNGSPMENFFSNLIGITITAFIIFLIWSHRSVFIIRKENLDTSLDITGQRILLAICIGFSLIPITLTGGFGLIVIGITLFMRWKKLWSAIHYKGVGTIFIRSSLLYCMAALLGFVALICFLTETSMVGLSLSIIVLFIIALNFVNSSKGYDYTQQNKCIKFIIIFCVTLGISGLFVWALASDNGIGDNTLDVADNTSNADQNMILQSNNLNDNMSAASMLSASTTELVHNHISQPDLQSMNPQSISTMNNNVGIVANDGRIIDSVDIVHNNTPTSTITIDDYSGTIRENGQLVGRVDNFGDITTIRDNSGNITTVDDYGTIRENGQLVGRVDNFGNTTIIRDNSGNITTVDDYGTIRENGKLAGRVDHFGDETTISKS